MFGYSNNYPTTALSRLDVARAKPPINDIPAVPWRKLSSAILQIASNIQAECKVGDRMATWWGEGAGMVLQSIT